MSEISLVQKVSEWITLILALIFVCIGIGLVSGVVFPEKIFLAGAMRYVLGLVLIGYGIFRIITVGRKIRRKKG
ncbi:MAG: hypothetical protein JSW64_04545 [Candidatus Zixiibacteriota bacterium]|nr:MAG: hypothetical protein JSW64_04545 [candidate division Zixibacteria bacterium]